MTLCMICMFIYAVRLEFKDNGISAILFDDLRTMPSKHHRGNSQRFSLLKK